VDNEACVFFRAQEKENAATPCCLCVGKRKREKKQLTVFFWWFFVYSYPLSHSLVHRRPFSMEESAKAKTYTK
jgi:hypothetical protein